MPAGFNWDLWLGPRESRPYHPAYAPYIWCDWWAFGTGSLGNLAVHNLDTAFDYGARLTELALLGNIALRVGKKIKWDAANMKASNAPEADEFIKESCRKGWELA